MKHAVFRCDASPTIGGGHVMRCLTLADALARDGWRATFESSRDTEGAVPALARSDHARAELGRTSWKRGDIDWLVVDRGRSSVEDERVGREVAARIAVIDDAARTHDCDVLIDQTPGRREEVYAGRVPETALRLTGAAYALVPLAFRQARAAALKRRHANSPGMKLLVSFGMTDPNNLTTKALQLVGRSEIDVEVIVAVGSAAPHLEAIKFALAGIGQRRELRLDVADMARLSAEADLALGNSGVGALERCVVGLPSLVAIAAADQVEVHAGLIEAEAALPVSFETEEHTKQAVAALRRVVGDPAQRSRIARRAAMLCDGLGARRVTMAFDPPCAADGGVIRLRPARVGDSEIMLAWQSDPSSRRFANNPAAPKRAEHDRWLRAKLDDTDCVFNIILHAGEPAGVLRLDATAPDRFRISILIAPEKRRIGIAQGALALARRLIPDAVLEAEVLSGNVASERLFAEAGFRRGEGLFLAEGRSV